MATEPNIYNAIGWAHLQLRGGLRNMVATTIGYTLIISILILATVRFNPLSSGRILAAWTVGLLGLQCGILLLFGCMTVGSAVRLDHTSKMIESHRLMPTAAGSAIFGYVLGAPCQALAMALANFAIGAVVANGASVALVRWLTANAILVSFAVFVWVIVVFFGFLAQTAFRWIVSVFTIGFWISQGHLLLLLPGLTVLASPLIGNSIFAMRLRTAQLSWEYMASAIGQLVIGSICFVAAARKYRRADVPALGAELGLVLLAAWIGLSMLGIYYWDSFSPNWLGDEAGNTRLRLIATILATMLIAIIPTAGAARAEVKWKHHRQVNDVILPRRPISPLIVAALAAALPVLITNVLPYPLYGIPHGKLRTAIVIVSFIFTISYMLRMIPLGKRRVWVIPAAFILLTWTGPVLADLIYHGLWEDSRGVTGIISTLSPAGALFEIWNVDPSVNPDIGLAVQASLAVGMAIFFYARSGISRRSEVVPA
ncbi:MAG TPA: hypothetical protein VGQ99_08485 [Tepidisphaeraceae bacterium]|jgi:hypothetical protein|nr:hypothetical protein [Tepidisphaeraceae bacterium]